MEKIVLFAPNGAYDIYVKSYDAKTGELEETPYFNEAKVYKTVAGAESSARSIFAKCYFGKKTTEHVYSSMVARLF